MSRNWLKLFAIMELVFFNWHSEVGDSLGVFLNDHLSVIYSSLSISADDKSIYSCLHGKYYILNKVRFVADIKNDIQSVVNRYTKFLV